MIEMIWRKPVIKAPPRLQRMLLRLQRYLITIRYKCTQMTLWAEHTLTTISQMRPKLRRI
ncbi:hypothetical protein MAR_012718 [Mya arenaria]|uniref:Uncharacterized protein n=1 Tax=Mya arenaria TaxID=6604 RepID=A0ABY7G0I3_MYAAR|nr:hypothetical protein MAR_012718 [Mya arenaria]